MEDNAFTHRANGFESIERKISFEHAWIIFLKVVIEGNMSPGVIIYLVLFRKKYYPI